MKITELASRKFVVTAEIGPPKGVDITEMMENATRLAGRVDAVNVTDQQSSVMRLSPLAVCHMLKEKGIESIFQMTCRDRNRIALQSDLLGAYVLGVENVLCLTGDFIALGDHPQAKSVFDLDSVSLLLMASQLQRGSDMAGKPLTGSPSFCLGAIVTPCADPIEPQIIKLEKKVKAGAQFIQTQAIYEPDKLAAFMKQIEHLKVPVLAGIVMIKSPAMAKFMNKNVAGIHVPDELIAEMEATKERTAKSIEIAGRLIKQMKPYCQGVHIMAIGMEKLVPEVIKAAGF